MNTYETKNYLIPSSGDTHAVDLSNMYSGPINFDWRQFNVDNFPFLPQGVFIDNTQGTSDFVITILPINYNVVCVKGTSGQFQFPAPSNQTCILNGNGQVGVFFVDFPVLPNSTMANIGGVVTVNVNNTIPIPVTQTSPFNVVNTPNLLNAYNTSLTATTASIVGIIGSIRKIYISIQNVSLATAANNVLTITGGSVIFKRNFYMPSSGIDFPDINLDFGDNAFQNSNLSFSLSTALTTGIIDFNVYSI